jgi:hypothetical protein
MRPVSLPTRSIAFWMNFLAAFNPDNLLSDTALGSLIAAAGASKVTSCSGSVSSEYGESGRAEYSRRSSIGIVLFEAAEPGAEVADCNADVFCRLCRKIVASIEKSASGDALSDCTGERFCLMMRANCHKCSFAPLTVDVQAALPRYACEEKNVCLLPGFVDHSGPLPVSNFLVTPPIKIEQPVHHRFIQPTPIQFSKFATRFLGTFCGEPSALCCVRFAPDRCIMQMCIAFD